MHGEIGQTQFLAKNILATEATSDGLIHVCAAPKLRQESGGHDFGYVEYPRAAEGRQ
jgi:hypothetical protein